MNPVEACLAVAIVTSSSASGLTPTEHQLWRRAVEFSCIADLERSGRKSAERTVERQAQALASNAAMAARLKDAPEEGFSTGQVVVVTVGTAIVAGLLFGAGVVVGRAVAE